MELWEVILRIAISMVIGGIIGLQREFKNNSAGFRTHILVSLGACIAMLTNEYLFLKYSDVSNMDVARMGSYVISGIGFLGAGSIIKDNMRVRGLTTAAGLWVVACLGISAGAGYYITTGVGTVIVILVLILLKTFEKKVMKNRNCVRINIEIQNSTGQWANVFGVLSKIGASIHEVHMTDKEGEWLNVLITTTPNGIKINDLYELLSEFDCMKVKSIKYI